MAKKEAAPDQMYFALELLHLWVWNSPSPDAQKIGWVVFQLKTLHRFLAARGDDSVKQVLFTKVYGVFLLLCLRDFEFDI